MRQPKPGGAGVRRQRHLRVPVLPEEEAAIKRQAAAAGLSTAAYLRNVGLGYQPRGVLDLERVHEMARIHGDLGRLGGLLKLWLTDDAKLAAFDARQLRRTIGGVLERIDCNQGQLREVMQAVVRTRGL